MAERINRIGADKYTIKVNADGDIVLDVGDDGKVTVSGNLDVLGETTSIGSSTLVVDDKTIVINNNDPGGDAGITDLLDGYNRGAGIIIERGPDAFEARLFYDEDLDSIRAGATPVNEGAFIFKLGNGNLSGIHTTSIFTDTNEDLYLLGTGTGVVTVVGTTDYEKQVWPYTGSAITVNPSADDKLQPPIDDDALVNAKGLKDYIRDYHNYNFQTKILDGELSLTSVEALDQESGAGTSRVEVTVDGAVIATFYETRFEVDNLRFSGQTITNNGINQDIILTGSGTGRVQVDGWQNFTIEADPAAAPSEGTTIYSKTLADGGTGLFFYNEDGTNDEFVSRNKALLYSIIF